MHPDQELAIREVAQGIDSLSDLLMEVTGCDEDDALETLHDLPDLVNRIQDREFKELLSEAVRRVPRPKIIRFNQGNPDEKYPGHAKFMPPVTTKHAFNAHVAQAVSPYVKAIVDKVAQDRNLQPPDLRTIEAVLEKTNWSRAAYEAKRMPPKPPPGQLRQFFTKYIFKPLDKATQKVPMATIWGLIGAGQILAILWTAIGGATAQVERAGAPVKGFNTWSRRKQVKQFKRLSRRTGVPWSGRGVY
jgi:hypothetical protein